MDKNAYGIVILAAGNSSRLGEPKQLLQFENKSLIRHVADAAVNSVDSAVIIVSGSNEKLISNELNKLPVHLIHNADWQEGMASSISVGIQEIIRINPSIKGVILAVSDQPFVTSRLFLDLIEKAKANEKCIVACSYEDTSGTPVLFPKQYFSSLTSLNGAEGAKKLLKKFAADVVTIPFPLGGIDIDTKEDYQKLLNR